MTHIHDLIDADLLSQRLDQRYINAQTHPHIHGYRILNYSNAAQFDKVWDEATLQCRGLIVDGAGNVVARPFRKFFNLGEMDSLPDGDFIATEKMDGSLGIAYLTPDEGVAIATRGSFTSDQALWATDWLGRHPDLVWEASQLLLQGLTPLFEIIYPGNRIVVNYGDREELVYLTSINQETGRDVEYQWSGAVAQRYGGLDLEKIQDMQINNAEGFVLQWDDGTRVKVKFDEYTRLHRLLTGVNSKTIWELLSSRIGLSKLIEVVPDEFYQWVKATAAELNLKFTEVEKEAFRVLSRVPRDIPRKEQAEIVKKSKYPGIVFLMLDQRDYADSIWKLIKPEAAKPFKVEV